MIAAVTAGVAMFFDRPETGQRAVLVHIAVSRGAIGDAAEAGAGEEAELGELMELARSAALEKVALVTGRRREPHPRFFAGPGKLEEIRTAIDAAGAGLVLFDHEISAAQQRNLESELGCRVMGRTELILQIFAQRARTHEGKLQVELAQYQHARSRLVRGWSHLDRQKGGVNLRGAGEKQLEMDQQLLGERIRAIEKKLAGVRRRRGQGRRQRRRASVPTVALVGYTNAGKSTLFNRLTESHVMTQDQLFATLDPTLRRLPLDGVGDVVLADTVGFIRDLPHSLVAAFKATLEEVASADLLVHVVDATAIELEMCKQQVQDVLAEIGAGDRPVLEVYNKIDRLAQQPRLVSDHAGEPAQVRLSAQEGCGMPLLREALAQRMGVGLTPRRVCLAPTAGKTRSWLYGLGAVLDEQPQENGALELTVRLDTQRFAQLMREPDVLLQANEGVPRISPSL